MSPPMPSQFEHRSSRMTGMGYVVPSAWNKRVGSIKLEDTGEENSSSLQESEFNFSSTFSEAEQGPFSPGRMSSADELFHNGRIRTLRPANHFHAITVYEEKPVIARVEVHENWGFRPSYYTSMSAPASPLQAPEGDFAYRYSSPHYSSAVQDRRKERGKLQEVPLHKPTAILNHSVSPEHSSNVFYKVSPLSRVIYSVERIPTGDESSVSEDAESTKPAAKPGQSGKTRRTLKDLLKEDIWTQLKKMNTAADSGRESEAFGKSKTVNAAAAAATTGRGREQADRAIVPPPWRSRDPLGSGVPPQWSGPLSPHHRHYVTQRAQAARMKKKTSLPYRQGVLGCLGFRSIRVQSSHYSLYDHRGAFKPTTTVH